MCDGLRSKICIVTKRILSKITIALALVAAVACSPGIPSSAQFVVVFSPQESVPPSLTDQPRAALFSGNTLKKWLPGVPVTPGSPGQLYYARRGIVINARDGSVLGKLPCAASSNGTPFGVAISPSGRVVVCIDAGDDAGPLLLLNTHNGRVRRVGTGRFLNIGPHELAAAHDVAYALLLDKSCGAVRGYEGYPLRAAAINLASGAITRLSCMGSIVLGRNGLIATRKDELRGTWWFFDQRWRRGHAQGTVGSKISFIRNGCLRVTNEVGCVARGVFYAYSY